YAVENFSVRICQMRRSMIDEREKLRAGDVITATGKEVGIELLLAQFFHDLCQSSRALARIAQQKITWAIYQLVQRRAGAGKFGSRMKKIIIQIMEHVLPERVVKPRVAISQQFIFLCRRCF